MNEPIWVNEARRNYRSDQQGKHCLETGFNRPYADRVVLEEYIPQTPQGKLSILIVGPGLECDGITCSFLPYAISGFLESKHIDYDLIIIDKSKEVIDFLKKNDSITLSHNCHQSDLSYYLRSDLSDYLQDTNQKIKKNSLKIPVSFQRKKKNNEITFINDDITAVSLSELGPFNYASITNVLYMLNNDGQKIALSSIANAMTKGGMILLDDYFFHHSVKGHILKEYDGWLDEDKQKDLNLKINAPLYYNLDAGTGLKSRIAFTITKF